MSIQHRKSPSRGKKLFLSKTFELMNLAIVRTCATSNAYQLASRETRIAMGCLTAACTAPAERCCQGRSLGATLQPGSRSAGPGAAHGGAVLRSHGAAGAEARQAPGTPSCELMLCICSTLSSGRVLVFCLALCACDSLAFNLPPMILRKALSV